MKVLLVASVALCIGLAVAAPGPQRRSSAKAFLTSLLQKRSSGSANAIPAWAPSHQELVTLAYLGAAIEFLAEKAEMSPAGAQAYIEGQLPKEPDYSDEMDTRAFQPATRQNKRAIGDDQMWVDIQQHGLYTTVLEHVKLMGKLLRYTGPILAHKVLGPDCTDQMCPALPAEVAAIFLGTEEDPSQSADATRELAKRLLELLEN